MKALRKVSQEGSTRQLGLMGISNRVHEYPAVAAPTWVVDTGASYDVVLLASCCQELGSCLAARAVGHQYGNWTDCLYPRGGVQSP